MNRYLPLALFLLAVLAASVLGGSFAAGSWYQDIAKPEWTPPDWLFGPAWGVIYVCMAVAAWLVWLSRHRLRSGALIWWFLVLALNVSWSWLMFGLHRPGWAFGVCVLIVAFSIMTCRAFFLVSGRAGLLLLPLVFWTAFACVLNYAIWSMNGGGVGQMFR